MFYRFVFVLIFIFGQAISAMAEEVEFGPFWAETSEKVILLNGEIDSGSALSFRRIVDAVPDAEVLILNSPGGIVQMGLLIADDVHRMGLATYIPEQAGCYSSCSLIFLAGKSRLVEGELGVHQLSNASSDLESAQTAISDIIDVLDRFDTPTPVLTAMFRTPPDEMYVFTEEEIIEYGLSRYGVEGTLSSCDFVMQRAPETVALIDGPSFVQSGMLPSQPVEVIAPRVSAVHGLSKITVISSFSLCGR